VVRRRPWLNRPPGRVNLRLAGLRTCREICEAFLKSERGSLPWIVLCAALCADLGRFRVVCVCVCVFESQDLRWRFASEMCSVFEGLPVEVRRLLRSDGSVVVPPSVVPWLELQLREQLRKARGNPSSPAVALLKALTTSAERFESSANGTRVFESGTIGLGEVSKPFLTSSRAAELTERTDRGIRRACEEGRLPAEKFGNAWHIAPKDLDNYVHRRGSDGQEG